MTRVAVLEATTKARLTYHRPACDHELDGTSIMDETNVDNLESGGSVNWRKRRRDSSDS